jgi:methylated-DNA-[protein]-cysteine S-methyltransferase
MTLAPANTTVYYHEIETPIGELLLAGNGEHLEAVYFQSGPRPHRRPSEWVHDAHCFASACAQLAAYFAGELQRFDLTLAPKGTAFQQSVWRALRAIPYGEVTSYGQLARSLDKPNGSRAVGLANGSNPIPIIIPCHRVIGANGSLTGFGGGLPTKRFLLDLERRHARAELELTPAPSA